MKPKGFTHLHNHSEYSPDGAGTIEAMIKKAASNNAKALALTDHGTLAGAFNFWSMCKQYSITPILGIEGYIWWNGKRHHITLNSTNKTGFENLIAVSNKAHERYTSGYPLMMLDDFVGHSEGLIALTGCPAGAIHGGAYEDGLSYVSNLKDIFGADRTFVEMMFVMSTDFISRPFLIARKLGLRLVVTNDCHFHEHTQAASHKIITECRKGYNYDSHELWQKDWAAMEKTGLEYFHPDYVREWMHTTEIITEMIEPWSMYSEPQLPATENAEGKLIEQIQAGFYKDAEGRTESDLKIRKDRLNYEFKTLKRLGFIDYIYILTDIVAEAHSRGIRVGPGRGSAAGSYVLYLLGITGVDPLDYDLMFERFVNPARKSFPDVDVDFESVRRQEIIDYAANKWGAVAVATYTHYSHKTATHDLARILHLPKGIGDEAAENGPESAQFETLAGLDERFLPTYNTMIGQVRNRGKHAGGIIITSVPIPIESNGKERLAAWTEGKVKALNKAGIVKFDFLGLTALSQLQEMVDILGSEPPHPSADDAPYQIFRDGNVNGIFQWTGSDGIRRLTMEIGPTNIDDLGVINSLYRPGALDAGTAKDYPKFKENPRKIHPDIDEILAPTNGVIVFQEQVMRIFAKMVGGKQKDLELARSTIIKARRWDPTWYEEMEELKLEFHERGAKQGYTDTLLDHVWAELETHGRYSFNASHSYAYAFVAYQMAWFKYYHPDIFYTGILRHDPSMAQTMIIEAVSRGIKIRPPHINRSTNRYELRDGAIWLPLTSVSHLGSSGAEQLSAERDKNGPFKSFIDFDNRTAKKWCTSRSRRLLYEIGGFDDVAGNPADAIAKFHDVELLSPPRAQMKALGFVIPDKETATELVSSSANKMVIGFITGFRDKESRYGAYRVFSVSPKGSFWMRHDDDPCMDLEKGSYVKAKKMKSGRSKNVQILKV